MHLKDLKNWNEIKANEFWSVVNNSNEVIEILSNFYKLKSFSPNF